MAALNSWDAMVIGGGLAGSSAAIQLVQAGQSVLLLEKEQAAHHKVCGEFISYEAQAYLAKLGLDLRALGAVSINQIRLIRGNKITQTALPFQALSLSRYMLDEALLNLAIAHGVQVIRGVTANNLVHIANEWRIDYRGSTDQLNNAHAKAVFLATGKHDLGNQPRPPGIQNNLIGFKMHFTGAANQSANVVDIILFDGGYAGYEQVENNIVNLCLLVTKIRFLELGKSWENLLADILSQTPLLRDCLKNAEPCWPKPLAIFGIPYGLVNNRASEPQLYRLGDQMAVIPSFCGNGMSIALHTASLAAKNYLHVNNANLYQQKAKQHLWIKVKFAVLLSQLVICPLWQMVMFKMCRFVPKFMRYIAVGTRL